MAHFNFGKFLLTSIILTVMSMILHGLDGVVALDFYKDPSLAPLWSRLMMPEAGPPPPSFFAWSFGFNFIMSVIFVLVYLALKNGVPGTSPASKGMTFGFLMFLVSGLTSALAMILIFNLPILLIGIWTAEDLILKLAGGAVAGAVNK